MKRKIGRIFAAFLVLVLSLSLYVPAFAEEVNVMPTPVAEDENLGPADTENAGALTPEEIRDRLNQPAPAGSTRVITGAEVTETYDGTIDRGEVESGYNDKTKEDIMPFSISRYVSNGFSLGLKLAPKSKIEATVGYDVEWGETRTFGYNATVSPKHTVHIEMKDCYHVSKLHTWKITQVWLGNSVTPTSTREDDYSAWAQQWYKPHFSAWEEPGNHAT